MTGMCEDVSSSAATPDFDFSLMDVGHYRFVISVAFFAAAELYNPGENAQPVVDYCGR